MTCIGVAWASILSMPYAILAPSLPKDKVGVLMGMFNLFIVIPQAVAAWKFGFVLDHFLHGEPMNALMFGGVTMAIAAVLTLVVVSHKNADGRAAVPVAGGAH
jgi:maltose/moltooligosaccharide transporter